MKLLFDQNLSRILARQFKDRFPEIHHLTSLGLKSASDAEIWNFARDNGGIAARDRYPSDCLSRNRPALAAFLTDPDSALMVMDADHVEIRGTGVAPKERG